MKPSFLFWGLVLAAQPAFAAPLSLESLVSQALRNHPSLQAARQEAEAQAARAKASTSPYFPQINLSSGVSRTTSISPSQTSATPFNLSSGGLSLRQQLYDFGKTQDEVKTAEALAQTTRFQAKQQEVEVAYGVRRAYLEWARAKGLEAQAVARLEAASRLYEQAQAFWKAGRRSRIDAIRAEANLAQARAERLAAKTSSMVAQKALAAALGQADSPQGEPVFPKVTLLVQKSPDELRELGLRHPLAQVGLSRLAGAQASREGASKLWLPDVVSDLSYGMKTRDTTNSQNWAAGVSINMPLFTGFSHTRLREAAQAQERVAQAELENDRLQLTLAIERAHLALEGAKEGIPAAAAALKSARENLALAEGRYRAGVGSIIEVSDAQALLATAENALTRAQADYHLAVADLIRAVGMTGVES